MDLTEFVCRSKQEALKRLELLWSLPGRALRAPTQARRGAQRAPIALHIDPLVPATLALHDPDHCKDIVAIADQLCDGRFNLLGYRNLDFGAPVDWHFDPVSGRRAPRRHWTRISPLDHETIGDTKVVCELNRHQWMVQLGQAWRITHDERYAEAIARYLASWLADNPAGMGINWTSSLELALRLIAWSWTLALISDSNALSNPLFGEVMESAAEHAKHIERYLSYYYSPNTHLTGEALGLFYASLMLPDHARSKQWQSLATRILTEEIERQVLADGVYFERTTCYQRYTIDTYLHFLILGRRAGIEISETINVRLKSMLDFLLAVQSADGSMPSIGDADGGCLLPLGRIDPTDFRATFSTAAVVLHEPAYARGPLAAETLWLSGASAATTFEALRASSSAPSDDCHVFPDGGFAIMKSPTDGHSLIFDAGPLGCPVSGGHGHADLLSIQCSVFGQPYLVDPGTCCYGVDTELRDFFRGTAAHSSITIDGRNQALPKGPFAWQSRPAAHLLRWKSNATVAYADGSHHAYWALTDPVSHRRRVVFVKPKYWIVVDDLTGSAAHQVDIRFQFAPMQVEIDNAGWIVASANGRSGLRMRAFSAAPFKADVREGRRDPLEGWIAPDYGRIEPAPVVVYTATTLLPLRAVTLLWPSADITKTAPQVQVIKASNGSIHGLTFPEIGESIRFEEEAPIIEHVRNRRNPPLQLRPTG